jgi:hypothetical protein
MWGPTCSVITSMPLLADRARGAHCAVPVVGCLSGWFTGAYAVTTPVARPHRHHSIGHQPNRVPTDDDIKSATVVAAASVRPVGMPMVQISVWGR